MYQPPAGDNVALRFNEAYISPDGNSVVLRFHGKMVYVASGGAIAGGTATVEAVNIQVATHVASGGAIAGGVGDAIRSREIFGSGGAIAGGVGDATRERSITSTGGAVVSGEAAFLREAGIDGIGGAVAGGEADLLAERRNILVFGVGGAIAGGEATIEAINLLVMELMASGGAIVGGAARTNRETSVVGSGGAVAAAYPQSSWPSIDGAFDAVVDVSRMAATTSKGVMSAINFQMLEARLSFDIKSEVDLDLVEA